MTTVQVPGPTHDAGEAGGVAVAARATALSKTYGEGAAPVAAAGRRCLVAVDGSAGSIRALDWGLAYAADRDMCVEVLTVWPDHRSVLVHEVPGHFNAARNSAHTAQQEAVEQALGLASAAPVTTTRLENADPAAAIVRASARCDLVVLGADLHDRSHSLTDRVLARASCTVVVVGRSRRVIASTAPALTTSRGPAPGL